MSSTGQDPTVGCALEGSPTEPFTTRSLFSSLMPPKPPAAADCATSSGCRCRATADLPHQACKLAGSSQDDGLCMAVRSWIQTTRELHYT